MTLNGVMAVTLRYFTEFGKPALQKAICGGIYARVYCILVRVQCRRKESSRSLSHLLMSFLVLHALTAGDDNRPVTPYMKDMESLAQHLLRGESTARTYYQFD